MAYTTYKDLKTIGQKLAKLKQFRENGKAYFCSEFKLKDTTLTEYYYHKYVFMNLRLCNSLEEFILRCCLERMEASKVLEFDEEFDWVYHCVSSAQLDSGKGSGGQGLKMHQYIHADYTLIKYYEIKTWKMFLDQSEGVNDDLISFINKIEFNKKP